MLPLIFFIDLSVESFIKVTKTLQDLTHVTGAIKNERYIKHYHGATKFQRSYYEDVFVFSLQGCDDEFGFLSSHNSYNDLTKVRYFGDNTIADIYYDKSGERIEENVTLQIFDLRIDSDRYFTIEDTQKQWKIGFIICSLISLILLALAFFVIKSRLKKK